MNQTLAIPVSLVVLIVAALAALAASNSGIQTFTSGTERVATDARCSDQVEDACGSSNVLGQIGELDDQCRQSLATTPDQGQCSAATESEGVSQEDIQLVAENPELVN